MIVARVGPEDPRKPLWMRLFFATSVPVTASTPKPTILPDGQEAACYFVDFRVAGAFLQNHLRVYNTLQKETRPDVYWQNEAMLREGIYPVIADGVTVIDAPDEFWRKAQWLPAQ